jgi:hypothetical protein
MPQLERIFLINAAGVDFLEFPVGGHCQVFGVNGHGKSTLLRTVLFFYLGTNDKAPYALHETKADFVSYYLNHAPSYLVYEVGRGDGKPSYHIAVSRPAGRIQFYFVDAPFQREFYVDGNMAQPIEEVEARWRKARCAVETYSSYDDFSQRIYGIINSTFSVYRPASRGSGQVGVLPRIISGIFTVSQLDADKLKAALTCGVRDDAQAELDLVLLKNQLENFRRANRAVRIYLRHEQNAVDLVAALEEFDRVKEERQRTIEDLVRLSKLLPDEAAKLEERNRILTGEEQACRSEFESQSGELTKSIQDLQVAIGVLDAQIKAAEIARSEYEEKEIDRKKRELDSLPLLTEDQRAAEQEYNSLTAKYEDERQRKEQIVQSIQQSWSATSNSFQERKGNIEKDARQATDRLANEKATATATLIGEQDQAKAALAPRRDRVNGERAILNADLKSFAEYKPPQEIEILKKRLGEYQRKEGTENTRQAKLKGDIDLAKEKATAARAKLERDTKDQADRCGTSIEKLEGERLRIESELDSFDASLAHFFQTKLPKNWPDAAKTLNRDTLFRSADELSPSVDEANPQSLWGLHITTEKLPEPSESYDREQLSIRLRATKKSLLDEKDHLQALKERFLSDADALEKATALNVSQIEETRNASVETRRGLLDEIVRIDDKIITLQSQYDSVKRKRLEELEKREAIWNEANSQLQNDEAAIERSFRTRMSRVDSEFKGRKDQLDQAAKDSWSAVEAEEAEAKSKRDAELARIERDFQKAISAKGVDASLVAAAKKRMSDAEAKITRISGYTKEVTEYLLKKSEQVDRLPSWESERTSLQETSTAKQNALQQLKDRHQIEIDRLKTRRDELTASSNQLKEDQSEVQRFKRDGRFFPELGCFDREDLAPASFYRPGGVADLYTTATNAHEERERLNNQENRNARDFLNRFDPDALKVLGFSPIYEHFMWQVFVGTELKPFVRNRGIGAMKRIQTQEFEQLIQNIRNKNADFQEGIRQVKKTAELVEAHLNENNFVDVLDSIELKVERVDNNLTRILSQLEDFAGLSFGTEQDLFAKPADRAQIERAIECFERLATEINNHKSKRLSLTDYFDFQIRVHENGHDMGWRKSLDHIGSTGTDYLVKMLIYLSLIEVYRARAIDPKSGTSVHCVLDETGVLAPKYVRSVLDYAATRGITLITAGHSQQTTGFKHWVLVRKHGNRFGGQVVLRKVLKCD